MTKCVSNWLIQKREVPSERPLPALCLYSKRVRNPILPSALPPNPTILVKKNPKEAPFRIAYSKGQSKSSKMKKHGIGTRIFKTKRNVSSDKVSYISKTSQFFIVRFCFQPLCSVMYFSICAAEVSTTVTYFWLICSWHAYL